MISKILMAYDGSAASDKAFEWALGLAKTHRASLHVISIARPPDFADEVESEAVIENSRKHYDSLLGRLRNRAAGEDVSARYSVVVGHPAEQVVIQAEKDGADLIVLGHRGKGLFKRLRLGSVSRQVLHEAHCAVLVVR